MKLARTKRYTAGCAVRLGWSDMSFQRSHAFAVIVLLGTGVSAAAPKPALVVAGLGDCEKITKDGAVPPSPRFWDQAARRLSLHGGRNEVVAAQLMLTARGGPVEKVDVEIGDLKGPGVIPADPNIALYLEAYNYVQN